MRFNVFAGARRIALVAAGLAASGAVIGLVTDEPRVSLSYTVALPDLPFVRSEKECPADGARHYFSTETGSRRSVSVNLCLLPMPFGDNNESLIPFKLDEKGMLWGGKSYSSEVSDYERRLEQRFTLSSADTEEVTREVSRMYWENMVAGLGLLAVGLACFGGFVWTTGWIVRGFLGIPRGHDERQIGAAEHRNDP